VLSREKKKLSGQHKRLDRFSSRAVPNVRTPRDFNSSVAIMAIVSLIIISVPVSICPAESSTDTNPHHFQLPCASCHQVAEGPNSTPDTTVGSLQININKACSRSECHDYDSGLNHPVGVQSNGHIPVDMPLNDMEQLTCLTCHDELNNTKGFAAYLRRAPGGEFCASCHRDAGGFDPKKSSHWQFTNEAHLQNNKMGSFYEEDIETIDGIDSESYTCLSCHDNISAVIPAENETVYERMQRWNQMRNHPIGMIYETRAIRKGHSFKMPFTIDSRIRFFNGRMGCGSCHNLYNTQRNNPVLESDRGLLCRQCHRR
jgi:predicted CXXCH cytochrome family protein